MRSGPSLAASLLACAALAVSAADDGPAPLRVMVGAEVDVCATGTLQCPPGAGKCDDPAIARPDSGEDGRLVFRGVAPGETLCSAASIGGAGQRQVFRVTVVKAPRPPPAPARKGTP